MSRDLVRFGPFDEAEIWSHDSFPNLICKNLGKVDVDRDGGVCCRITNVLADIKREEGEHGVKSSRQVRVLVNQVIDVEVFLNPALWKDS